MSTTTDRATLNAAAIGASREHVGTLSGTRARRRALHAVLYVVRPLIFLQDKDMRTLALGLRLFRSEYLVQWNLMMAASALVLLPILVLFFAAQRYFVRGIVMTGING